VPAGDDLPQRPRPLTPFAPAFLRDVALAYANVAGADSGLRLKAFDLLRWPSSRPGTRLQTARQFLSEIRPRGDRFNDPC